MVDFRRKMTIEDQHALIEEFNNTPKYRGIYRDLGKKYGVTLSRVLQLTNKEYYEKVKRNARAYRMRAYDKEKNLEIVNRYRKRRKEKEKAMLDILLKSMGLEKAKLREK